nr:MBL fold metallo-hydrolase [uncultured Oscillibacter sp.]
MNMKMLPVGPLETNCYILEDEKTREAAVIDPGADAPAIIAALEGTAVRYILLTHGHYDHTGAAEALLKAYPDAALYIHEADFLGVDPALFPLSAGRDGVKFYGEGDSLPLGELTLQVFHTPGHSKGSVTLRCGNLLFCGDTLFAGSCGRTDLAGGSMTEMLASLRRLGELEGDLQVLPGHMETSTLEAERRYNPYLRQALREKR